MTFEPGHREAFVWLRRAGESEPVLCGRVSCDGPGAEASHTFVYGRSYLSGPAAMPLTPHNLPARRGPHHSPSGLHGVLRDAAPDAWGRRVLAHRLALSDARAGQELTEVDYLLGPGQARPGALLFSATAEAAPDPAEPDGDLAASVGAMDAVESDSPMTPEMEAALVHGTSIGGARPKTLAHFSQRPVIAKFAAQSDTWPVVAHEVLALHLARAAGIDTPDWERVEVAGRDALMVHRFDIDPQNPGGRRHFFSTLTALGLGEMQARYAGYPDLADFLNGHKAPWPDDGEKLSRRMVFNILVGNTDDHARNHAVFWDGESVALTPAYDLCVQPRVGQSGSQAMGVGARGREATLSNALSEAYRFGIDHARATEIAAEVEQAIREHWAEACDVAGLAEARRDGLWGKAVLSAVVLG